ncbi:MAG: YraN family protein [Planctomycetota bacterium]
MRLRQAGARHFPRLWLRVGRPTPAELGLVGEALAARLLRRAGARLLGRRLRTAWGELDLVAERGEQLLIVEVKTRRIRFRGDLEHLRWRPRDAITEPQRRRLAHATERLMRSLGRDAARLELIEVLVWVDGAIRVECLRHNLATFGSRKEVPPRRPAPDALAAPGDRD